MKRVKKNPKKKLKHMRFNAKKYFFTLGIMLAVAVVVGAIFMGCDFSKSGVDGDEDSSLVEVDLKKEGKINVLLLGVDVEGLRTDAIMVASYDIENDSVNMLSIPRDTRMYVGTKYQKINAAHAIGGMKGKIAGPEGTIEAVTRLTGIPINYYVEFSFSAIDNFIDALGGVEFDVPDVEGKGRGMNYDDPYQNLHIHLKPGLQTLKGNQVQQLLRYRKSSLVKNGGYAEGDLGRVQMQQNFVKALVDQKLNAKLILKLPDIFEQLSKDIKTNFTVSDITKYAGYLKGFSSDKIATYHLPGENNGVDYGASYWICDLAETKVLVESVFGYDASKITIDSPDGTSKAKNSKTTTSTKSTSKTSTKATVSQTAAPETTKNENTAKSDNTTSTAATATPQVSEKPKSAEKPKVSEKPKTTSAAKATAAPETDADTVSENDSKNNTVSADTKNASVTDKSDKQDNGDTSVKETTTKETDTETKHSNSDNSSAEVTDIESIFNLDVDE